MVSDYESNDYWILHKSNFTLAHMPNTCLYLQKTFTFTDAAKKMNYVTSGAKTVLTGKIVAVVSNYTIGHSKLHFKYYDCVKHPKHPPLDDDKSGWYYSMCKDIITTSVTKTHAKWCKPLQLFGKVLINRRVQRLFDNERWFIGKIVKYDANSTLGYHIVYEDGDEEDISQSEVLKGLLCN